jgi:hypothetical protein
MPAAMRGHALRWAMQVNPSELKKIKYLRTDDIGGRNIPLQPYFDGKEWHVWAPASYDELVRLQAPDWCQGRYFAAAPARPDDGVVSLLDFLTKRAYFGDIVPVAHAIEHDILSLSAALWKIDLLFAVGQDSSLPTAAAAATDVEYVLVTCRSMLDLLQLAVHRLWKRVKLTIAEQERGTIELPRSLADVVAKGDSARSVDDIRSKFRLPEPFVQFYSRSAEFALKLRRARGAIVHLPTDSPFVFRLERGFGVKVDSSPFHELVNWESGHCEANGIGSLRFFLAAVILHTLRICEDAANTFMTNLELPSDVAPGLHVFLRSPHVGVLHRLEGICESPWSPFTDIRIETNPRSS